MDPYEKLTFNNKNITELHNQICMLRKANVLTEDILKSNKISIDIDGFNNYLEEQKNRAKWAGSGEKKKIEQALFGHTFYNLGDK